MKTIAHSILKLKNSLLLCSSNSKLIYTMRKIVLLIFTCIAVTGTIAQTSGGPDAFGYEWRDSNDPSGPTFNWIDITTTSEANQITGLADDNTVGPFPIGFPFTYYWYTVNSFRIGSNGYIIFNNSQIASPFPSIPNPTGANDFIAGMMSDLNFDGPGNPGQVWAWTNPANDSLVVSFINVPFWNVAPPTYTGSNTFQMILTTVDSSITFQYLQQTGITNSNDITIGIENISGNVGLMHSKNTYPVTPYAIKFYYPQNSTYQVTDASVEYVDNPSSGGIFLSKDGSPYTMEAEIKNTGNQPLNPFNVDMRILNLSNQVQAQDVLMTTALAPAQTDYLVSPVTFNPTVAGTYRFYTTTQLPGDATPSNNEGILEIRVVDTTQTDIVLTYTGIAPVPAGSAISWSGGSGGVGVEIVPPFYPARITELHYYIVSNPNGVGFAATVFDDSGPGGTPGNILDSIVISGGSVLPGIYNPVVLPNPIVINSGSFYVGWMMLGDGIQIGQDNTSPISNRTYEILGNVWAIYRSRHLTDLMVQAVIQKISVGIDENQIVSDIGNFYPVPASEKATIDFTVEKAVQNMQVKLFNIQGQLIRSQSYLAKNIGKHSITVDVTNLSTGVYLCEITAGNDVINKKLVVGR
jgi:hypothetical protein